MSIDCSILIPAHNEVGYIEACLEALLASDVTGAQVEVIVMANGCTDATVDTAQGYEARFTTKGWPLTVLDIAQGGKMSALNAGDATARHAARIYVDADVIVSPLLVAQLAEILETDVPRYASGGPVVTVAQSAFTRIYARFWESLPFCTHGVPGFGVFAVNGAGRARWGAFPDIISDDTFVRLSFAPSERVRVPATYRWPMIEGASRLIKVRRRQDIGVAEVKALYPALWANHDQLSEDVLPMWQRALRDPIGFSAFAFVGIAVRLPHSRQERWARGR
ncbi:glycosyltransferase family 2 protein [Sulfitobacter guttiformis]|uniref:Glycosyltransferase involved in cell wall biosynthesis n=1 Tax=Sulfitobacter guttiformis TaxID=74349 RepID=A0A420DNK5_9RHOB|nr:glycosyltransferase [Sulfitobacter guttiformis]KIN73196.1 Glycosyl transferase, group 2 family protein [Sulfitobacter guttiformis KCTC 32187]RKE95874.1 glycosyltransferase involved in cell wall biosynthesis [Sulfitobacter guttiformis]